MGLMKMRQKRVKWDRLASGLALAAAAGTVFGHVWTLSDVAWWWVGSLTLLCGTLLIISSFFARGFLTKRVAPPLGEMLLTKGLITEVQLGQALARQHRYGGTIGQILVEMKLVSPVELTRVLQEQLASRNESERARQAPAVCTTVSGRERQGNASD